MLRTDEAARRRSNAPVRLALLRRFFSGHLLHVVLGRHPRDDLGDHPQGLSPVCRTFCRRKRSTGSYPGGRPSAGSPRARPARARVVSPEKVIAGSEQLMVTQAIVDMFSRLPAAPCTTSTGRPRLTSSGARSSGLAEEWPARPLDRAPHLQRQIISSTSGTAGSDRRAGRAAHRRGQPGARLPGARGSHDEKFIPTRSANGPAGGSTRPAISLVPARGS